MRLEHIDMQDDTRIRDALGMRGMQSNPTKIDMDRVIPVFDLNGHGFGTNKSPMRLTMDNFLHGPEYTYELDGLTGLYCPAILDVGMVSGYDTADTSPDWGYIGWIPRGKVFVPLSIDWTLSITGSLVEVNNYTFCVDLILYMLGGTSGYLGAEGVRLALQHQQMTLHVGNGVYRSGTYGMGLATTLTLPQFNWSGGFDFTFDKETGIGSITEKTGGNSIHNDPGAGTNSITCRTVVVQPFRVPVIPEKCGLGFYVHFDHMLTGDETLWPTGTSFIRRINGFLFDANQRIPQLMI
jgi:hypothetical protein